MGDKKHIDRLHTTQYNGVSVGGWMDQNRNPAIERLLRWIVSKATMLMIDSVRWEIVIAGKGSQYSCRYTVYEDPP